MEVKVEAQIKQIKMLHLALTSTLACSVSLAAALPAERRVLARRGWAGEHDSLFEHPEVV